MAKKKKPRKKKVRSTAARRRPFRFLWVTDPWDTLDHSRDTTLRLAAEAEALGHESHWCDLRTIRLESNQVRLDAVRLGTDGKPVSGAAPAAASPDDFDQIHYRTDPPVDLAYIHPLQLLLAGSQHAEIVNPPGILLAANEKFEALGLARAGLSPCSCISSREEDLRAFGREHGKVVLKPLHEAQSKGVELLDFTSAQAESAAVRKLAGTTMNWNRPVIVQTYLPGIANGELRLWFADGRLVAHARKLPLEGDFRVQIDRGSRLEAKPLSTRDKASAKKIGAYLRRRGIRLAAVDLIDEAVTDFNFTSPGLLVQMEALARRNLAREVIRQLVK